MIGTLTRRVGAVAVSRTALAATALATNMLFAWLLSKQANGTLQKVFVVTQIAILAGSFGIQTSLYYFLPRSEPEKKRGLVAQSAIVLTMAGALLALIIAFAAPGLSQLLGRTDLTPLLRAGALTVLCTLPGMVCDPMFITEKRAWLAAFNAINSGAFQLVAVSLVIVSQMPLQAVFYALSAAGIVRLLPGIVFWIRQLPAGAIFAGGMAMLTQQLAYVLPVGIASIADSISSWLDRTLVAGFYNEVHLATYTYGAIEIPFLSLLIGSVMPVLLPEFSLLIKEGHRQHLLELWNRATLKASTILFGLFFLFAWAAPEFIVTLYSQGYRDSAWYFRIYLLLIPVRVIAFMPLLFALGKAKAVMHGAIAEVLINLCASLILMRWLKLGMSGAALGTVFSTLCQAAYYSWHIRTGLQVDWKRLLPWRDLSWQFLRAAIFFLPLALLKVVSLPAPVAMISACAYFAIYAWFYIWPLLKNPRGEAPGLRAFTQL
jgi:O-antigen/teichoic acid export membrane protein